uniref:Uncharacterized protein n=1 Tax=Globodera rostochiensis TaxID=31243 RepID=A0A914HAA3_GLORO
MEEFWILILVAFSVTNSRDKAESVQLEELEELPLQTFDEIFGEGWWDKDKADEWDKLTLEHNFHHEIDRQNTQLGQIEPNSTDQNPPLTVSDHSDNAKNAEDERKQLDLSLTTIYNWKRKLGQTAANKYAHDKQKELLMKSYYKIKDKTPKIRDEDIAKMLKIGSATLPYIFVTRHDSHYHHLLVTHRPSNNLRRHLISRGNGLHSAEPHGITLEATMETVTKIVVRSIALQRACRASSVFSEQDLITIRKEQKIVDADYAQFNAAESVQLEELEELPLQTFDELFVDEWWDKDEAENLKTPSTNFEQNFHHQIDRQNTQLGKLNPIQLISLDKLNPIQLISLDKLNLIQLISLDKLKPIHLIRMLPSQSLITMIMSIQTKMLLKMSKKPAPHHKHKHSHSKQKELMKRYYEIKDKNPKNRDEDIAKMLKIGRVTLFKWKKQFKLQQSHPNSVDGHSVEENAAAKVQEIANSESI